MKFLREKDVVESSESSKMAAFRCTLPRAWCFNDSDVLVTECRPINTAYTKRNRRISETAAVGLLAMSFAFITIRKYSVNVPSWSNQLIKG